MKRTKKLDFDVTLNLFGADPFRDRQSGSGNMALIKEALHEKIRDRLTDRQRQSVCRLPDAEKSYEHDRI